jgi:hypothetical protein
MCILPTDDQIAALQSRLLEAADDLEVEKWEQILGYFANWEDCSKCHELQRAAQVNDKRTLGCPDVDHCTSVKNWIDRWAPHYGSMRSLKRDYYQIRALVGVKTFPKLKSQPLIN